MADATNLRRRAEASATWTGLVGLLRELGLEGEADVVPHGAWPAWGLAAPGDVECLVIAGHAGTLTGLVLQLGASATANTIVQIARGIRRRNPAKLYLFAFADAAAGQVTVGTFASDAEFRYLRFEPARVLASDVDALQEMMAGQGETGLELALRHARALDRSRITRRFFDQFRARRDALSRAWTGIPASAGRERAELSLLLLSRLTFLYFLQRRGALAGDDRYLPHLFGAWCDGPPEPGSSFYRARLRPLFFGALNRRLEDREPQALDLGALPYLNGGLFEPHAHERAFPDLDLPDREVLSVLDDLLERYRFTSREAGTNAGFGVDPEVLGRVFEGLMDPDRRDETGSYYTPAPVVHRIVREALKEYVAAHVPGVQPGPLLDGRVGQLDPATRYRTRETLQRVRILDPACGSGAFLVGALHSLASALGAVTDGETHALRQKIVARSLHGVDLLDDAALLCSLRLWLALAEDGNEIRPLPNLDHRIRQGDALLDPLDLAATRLPPHQPWHPAADPDLRRALRAVPAAAVGYTNSEPAGRAAARQQLANAESVLARHWVRALSTRQREWIRHFRAAAADRDLFGERPRSARTAEAACKQAQARLGELEAVARQIKESGALPFFSFGVHFAAAERGFDIILSNPPWVRSHRWPQRLRSIAAERFEVCRHSGWPAAARLTGVPAGTGSQVDLSLLFVERAIRLLAPGGVLAVLVPAKALRALYGGGLRRIMLRDLEFALIEDHSLDPHAMFRADTFPAIFVARRPGDPGSDPGSDVKGTAASAVQKRLVRPSASAWRGGAPLRWSSRSGTWISRCFPVIPHLHGCSPRRMWWQRSGACSGRARLWVTAPVRGFTAA